jgi:hypothetical protein
MAIAEIADRVRGIVLGAVFMVGSIGCYDPVTRDCAVACAAPGDCAAGQICGSDGFCAAPEVAGTCGDEVEVGAAQRTLHLVVEGRGRITTSQPEVLCEGLQDDPGDCWFAVAADAEIAAVAVSTHHHWEFEGWDQVACGESPTCSVSMADDVVLTARFRRD